MLVSGGWLGPAGRCRKRQRLPNCRRRRRFRPAFPASFAGDSDGTIIVIPRDVTGGISYLVEIGAYDTVADEEVTLRYGSKGFDTLSTDFLPNPFYEPRIKVPGDYSRTMFADGTTSGSLQVGTGVIELINVDGGLDDLIDHAVDGRTSGRPLFLTG